MRVSPTFRVVASSLSSRAKTTSRTFLASRLPYGILRKRALQEDPITILMYHTLSADTDDCDAWTSVAVGEFRRQIDIVRESYDIVSLDEALGESVRRRPQAVVTFDDGDVGLFYHLLPFIQELRIPVTVYVATGQIETGIPYWFDRLMNALNTARPVTIELGEIGRWVVGEERGLRNWLVISEILETLKGCSPDEREAAAAAVIAQTRGVERRRAQPLMPMSKSQLQALAAIPWCEIGAHTECHGLLDQMPLENVMCSVRNSVRSLEAWTGRKVRHFAYPNGNFNRAVEQSVADIGFATAVAVGDTLCARSASRHAMTRIGIGRFDTGDRFKMRLLRRARKSG